MKYNQVTEDVLQALREAVGEKYVHTDEDKLEMYKTDEEGNPYFHHRPEVVVFPGTAKETAAVMKIANTYLVPVTPRSGGTGLAGGAIPSEGGIVLVLDRMNRILEINEDALYAVVETGVRTCDIQAEAKKRGLLYAGDPCSSESCQIGGNVATNAGGNKAVRYGTTRNQIYSVEMVTPEGEIVEIGARLQKCSTGFCLEQLVCGSEGLLGIITKVTLKLRPLPTHFLDMLAIFESVEKAVALPNKILKAGIEPTSIEFMENESIKLCSQYIQTPLPYMNDGAVYVIVSLDSMDEDDLDKKTERLCDLCEAEGAIEIVEADDRIWNARRNIAEACRDRSLTYYAEDYVVPLDHISEILKEMTRIADKHGIERVTVAHIGDGNMHTNLLNTQELVPMDWLHKIEAFHNEFFPVVYEMGGRLSGEHGIGLKKAGDFKQHTDPVAFDLMMRIKKAWDPNGILNPGKLLPQENQ